MFGNVNDKKSTITQTREENEERLFYSLEMLHALPNVNYLAKVRNSDREKVEAKIEKAEASKA